MAREASPLTVAIRNLCDETNFEITHSAARPRLVALGFEMAPEPNAALDADVAQFETALKSVMDSHEFEKDNEEHLKELRGIAGKNLGWTDHKVRTVYREMENRRLFKNERNSFDVCKYNWKSAKSSAEPTPSRKPTVSPQTRAAVAARTNGTRKVAEEPVVIKGPKPKHRPGTPTPATTAALAKAKHRPTPTGDGRSNDEAAALDFVRRNGGIAAVKAMAAKATADAASLREQADAKDAEAAKANEMVAAVEKLMAEISAKAA